MESFGKSLESNTRLEFMILFARFLARYFDQIPYGEITDAFVSNKGFDFFQAVLSLLNLSIIYIIYFITAKITQVTLALLLQIDTQSIKLFYFGIPILYFLEIGLSKSQQHNLMDRLKFLLRASLKFSIVVGVDALVTSITQT